MHLNNNMCYNQKIKVQNFQKSMNLANKNITINTSKGKIKIINKISTQSNQGYFDLYSTSAPATFCLVYNNLIGGNKSKSIIQRIQQSYRILEDKQFQGIKIYEQMCELVVQNKITEILLYTSISEQTSFLNLKTKLSQNSIIDLSVFLVSMVVRIKQCTSYLGSFWPERIFYSNQFGFCLIGGDYFTAKCTSAQFLSQNELNKNQLLNQWMYKPPQFFNQSATLNYSSDLFVIGCLIYEVITGEYPFSCKKSLLQKQMPSKQNYCEITKQICNKILRPLNPDERIEPEELLRILQMQRGKSMFNTNKLQINIGSAGSKPGFFDNFQEFIMKCTTETEGWFLYYCENNPLKPDDKYLQQILNKVARKSEKINKIASLIEKCGAKPIKQQNSTNLEDNSYSILKMGILIINLLRKVPLQTIEAYNSCFTKVSSQIISKKPQNKLISILYKSIAFKVSLQIKFSQFSGNFHLNIENSLKISPQSEQYLSQYCLKILSYLKQFQDQDIDNCSEVQNYALVSLCDQIYDAVSTLLFCLMGMKKDNSLKIADREQISPQSFQKLDKTCTQIVQMIGRLCNSNPLFARHEIYSINSNYYQYQQQLCLMYVPVLTSYQYFYLDKNQYKGLSLPKDYSKLYEAQKKQFEYCGQNNQKYANRRPMLNRMVTKKQESPKSKINNQKGEDKKQTIKSGFGPSQHKNQSNNSFVFTEKRLDEQKQIDFFSQFFTDTKYRDKQKNNDSNSSNSSNVKNETQPTCHTYETSWLQADDNIFSYEWLKKIEKVANIHFQKPELDPVIYLIYENIIKGLRLHELIETLDKNKKVIVDPNQILFQKVIGSGSAGQVYIGKYQQNIVAIKKVKTASNPNALKQFEREVLTYIKIKSHPCLVSLVGLTKFNEDYFLLTQFCQGGSLFDLLHKRVNQIALSWSQRISIAIQIARGMEVLHFMDPPVIHRDMKSLNVFMVKKNNRWAAKVADFGLSRSPDADMMTSALGTIHWMAPELLMNKQYSLKVDVYSYAVVLWQICSRRTPYHNIANQMGIVKHVALEKGRPLLELINEDCPTQLVDLMKKCWSQDPEDRPYFPQIIGELQKIKI